MVDLIGHISHWQAHSIFIAMEAMAIGNNKIMIKIERREICICATIGRN